MRQGKRYPDKQKEKEKLERTDEDHLFQTEMDR